MRPAAPVALALVLAGALALAGCGGPDGAGSAAPPELTVAEAVEQGAEGRAIVRGTLFSDAAGVRLCAAIAESYPPQCGRPFLRVEGDPGEVEWEEADGVRWTGREVALEGELRAGVLRLGP